jgi:hypothetical protein
MMPLSVEVKWRCKNMRKLGEQKYQKKGEIKAKYRPEYIFI